MKLSVCLWRLVLRKQLYSGSVLSVYSPCTSWLCIAVVSGRCVRIGRVQSVVDFGLLLGGFGGILGFWRRVEEVVVAEGTAA